MEILLPHIEDDLREGNFEMTYSTFIGPDGQTEISYQHGSDCECNECETTRWERIERENSKQSYGVYGLNELDNRHDHLCRCEGCNYDGPEPTEEEARRINAEMGPEPIDISDEDVTQVWGDSQAKQLDAISAIQKEERDVAHSLYTALCGLWLATCDDRDMAEARTAMRVRIADMRAFVDSVEVELGL